VRAGGSDKCGVIAGCWVLPRLPRSKLAGGAGAGRVSCAGRGALWFARNMPPGVEASERALATEDASALENPDAALGTA